MARPRPSTLPPQLDRIVLGELTAGRPEQLVARADLDGVSFLEVTVPLLELGGGTVHGCAFVGVSAREGDWKATRIIESTFERLDVPVLRGARGVWRDVRMEGARLGSVEAYEASWHSVEFVGCKLAFVNLRGADLLDVAFTDCVIEDLDLVQTTARRVSLRGSRVARLNLQHTTLEHVDLRGADLEEVNGLDGLRGATISPAQLTLLAPLLAREKGVKVEDV